MSGRQLWRKAGTSQTGSGGAKRRRHSKKFNKNYEARTRLQRAFALARVIRQRGQRPRLVVTNAMEGLGDMAERAIAREIDRILARI